MEILKTGPLRISDPILIKPSIVSGRIVSSGEVTALSVFWAVDCPWVALTYALTGSWSENEKATLYHQNAFCSFGISHCDLFGRHPPTPTCNQPRETIDMFGELEGTGFDILHPLLPPA